MILLENNEVLNEEYKKQIDVTFPTNKLHTSLSENGLLNEYKEKHECKKVLVFLL